MNKYISLREKKDICILQILYNVNSIHKKLIEYKNKFNASILEPNFLNITPF